jgi:hypothetical protein
MMRGAVTVHIFRCSRGWSYVPTFASVDFGACWRLVCRVSVMGRQFGLLLVVDVEEGGRVCWAVLWDGDRRRACDSLNVCGYWIYSRSCCVFSSSMQVKLTLAYPTSSPCHIILCFHLLCFLISLIGVFRHLTCD